MQRLKQTRSVHDARSSARFLKAWYRHVVLEAALLVLVRVPAANIDLDEPTSSVISHATVRSPCPIACSIIAPLSVAGNPRLTDLGLPRSAPGSRHWLTLGAVS